MVYILKKFKYVIFLSRVKLECSPIHPNMLSYQCSTNQPPQAPTVISPPSAPTVVSPPSPPLFVSPPTPPGTLNPGGGSNVFGSEPKGNPNTATSAFYSLLLLFTCGLLASLQLANYI